MIEKYFIDPKTEILARKLVLEFEAHEAEQTRIEAETCRACLFYKTCRYSIFITNEG